RDAPPTRADRGDARGLPRARSPPALGLELRARGRGGERAHPRVPCLPRARLGPVGGREAAGRGTRDAPPRRGRGEARPHLGGWLPRVLRQERPRPAPAPR